MSSGAVRGTTNPYLAPGPSGLGTIPYTPGVVDWVKRLRKLGVSLIKPTPSRQALALGATFLLALLLVGAKDGDYIAPIGWATGLILHTARPVREKQSPICPPA